MPQRNLSELQRIPGISSIILAANAGAALLYLEEAKHFFRYLDTNGDGSGENNANGDYSSASQVFSVAPPAGVIFLIYNFIVSVEDVGQMGGSAYGANIALTNGISIRTATGAATDVDLTAGLPIVVNADWGRLAYEMVQQNFSMGRNFIQTKLSFAELGGPIVLDGDKSQKLEVTLNDDFTGLNSHYFQAQGLEPSTAPYRALSE